jgi:hypothetical protein
LKLPIEKDPIKIKVSNYVDTQIEELGPFKHRSDGSEPDGNKSVFDGNKSALFVS